MNINNENSLLKQQIVYDLTPFSHIDFPGYLSCIVWLSGCNMRCDYCYNKDIVFSKSGQLTFQDVLEFLKKRVGLLDGVVLSGGEATQHYLINFCKEVKKLGFLIKLDTNGTNFNQIRSLIDLNLIDYIALDYKAPKYKFTKITHSSKFSEFSKTLEFLIQKNFLFEVRTTIHNDLLDETDINEIINDLYKKGYKYKYYLQNYLHTNNSIANMQVSKKSFDKELLNDKLNTVVWR